MTDTAGPNFQNERAKQLKNTLQKQLALVTELDPQILANPFTGESAYALTVSEIQSCVEKALNNVGNYPPIQNFSDFYEFFQKTVYTSKAEHKEFLSSQLATYNIQYYHPILKSFVLSEDVVLVDLDSPASSLDFPSLQVKEIVDPKSNKMFAFISHRNGFVMTTTPAFVMYVMMGSPQIDRITQRQIHRLVTQVERFRKANHLDFDIFFKCEHPSKMQQFISNFQHEIASKVGKAVLGESWRYFANIPWWKLEYVRKGSIHDKLILLEQERQKGEIRGKKRQMGKKYPKVTEAAAADDASAISFLDTSQILNIDNVLSLGGKMDDILNTPATMCMDIDIQMMNKMREIEDLSDILPPALTSRHNLAEVAERHPAVREFLQFQSETDYLQLTLLEISDQTYDFQFSEENSEGQLTLINVERNDTKWKYPFSHFFCRNMYSIFGAKNFRIYLIHPSLFTVIEVKSTFLLEFFKSGNFELNADTQDELNDIIENIFSLITYDKISLGSKIRIYCQNFDLIPLEINNFIFSEKLTKNLLGGWKKTAESDNHYIQIYPPPEYVKGKNEEKNPEKKLEKDIFE